MGRSLDRAQEGAAQIAALGVRVHAMSCDVRLPEAVAAAFDEAEEALGPIGLLANNAGANSPVLAENISANARSEEPTPELQSLMRLSYAGFRLNKTTNTYTYRTS